MPTLPHILDTRSLLALVCFTLLDGIIGTYLSFITLISVPSYDTVKIANMYDFVVSYLYVRNYIILVFVNQ